MQYKMSTLENNAELEDVFFDRNRLKRSCSSKQEQQTRNSESDKGEDSFDSEPADDNSSDEDFSLNKPKKKRKKSKRKPSDRDERNPRTRSVRKVNIPSFDQVMQAQIQHAQKFIDYDIFGSETSSIEDRYEVTDHVTDDELEARERTPTPEPPKEKRKKIIIYPWNPIGITGGRPMPDSTKHS